MIAQPWSEITRRDFVTQGTMSILLRGNLWGRIVSLDPDGLPSQVQLTNRGLGRYTRPNTVWIRRSFQSLILSFLPQQQLRRLSTISAACADTNSS